MKVGVALGLVTFASGIARAGYAGACKYALPFLKTCRLQVLALNPARCLGLMAAAGKPVSLHIEENLFDIFAERFDYHYIHWVGDITAAMLNGIMYWLIPIYKD